MKVEFSDGCSGNDCRWRRVCVDLRSWRWMRYYEMRDSEMRDYELRYEMIVCWSMIGLLNEWEWVII